MQLRVKRKSSSISDLNFAHVACWFVGIFDKKCESASKWGNKLIGFSFGLLINVYVLQDPKTIFELLMNVHGY
jgi:hypothetical protein